MKFIKVISRKVYIPARKTYPEWALVLSNEEEVLQYLNSGLAPFPRMVKDGMLNTIKTESIRVNQSGGYCGLQSWLDMWEMEILQKENRTQFP